MKTPTTLSGAPEIQPTHKSGALKIVTTQILSAFAALGITASVTENAEGATILV